jgi:hypothetical protein
MSRPGIAVLLLCLTIVGCGGNDSSPTAPTPTPTPTPTTFTLSGRVTSSAGGGGIGSATVRIADGPNAGRSATTAADGSYALTGLALSGFSVSASALNYTNDARSVTLTSSQTVNFVLTPTPVFARSGVGDTVFDMPTTVRRVRITGAYSGRSSNFIVHIGGAHIVNELLGTTWGPTTFDGTYTTTGGVVEILSSSGVAWSFTEVR